MHIHTATFPQRTMAALCFPTKGFCLVCFAAVAAFHALDALGCGRVAMLDFDVHHGNGVAALVKGDARVCANRLPFAMQGCSSRRGDCWLAAQTCAHSSFVQSALGVSGRFGVAESLTDA